MTSTVPGGSSSCTRTVAILVREQFRSKTPVEQLTQSVCEVGVFLFFGCVYHSSSVVGSLFPGFSRAGFTAFRSLSFPCFDGA